MKIAVFLSILAFASPISATPTDDASALLQSGKFPEAAAAFAALPLDAGAPGYVAYLKALSLHLANRQGEAIAAAGAVPADSQWAMKAKFLKASALTKSKKHREAEAIYAAEAARAFSPPRRDALVKALLDFANEAENPIPGGELNLPLPDWEKAALLCEKVLEIPITVELRAEVLFRKAMLYHKSGQHRAVEQAFHSWLLQFDPDWSPAFGFGKKNLNLKFVGKPRAEARLHLAEHLPAQQHQGEARAVADNLSAMLKALPPESPDKALAGDVAWLQVRTFAPPSPNLEMQGQNGSNDFTNQMLPEQGDEIPQQLNNGLRSGDQAISRNSIDSIINNPNQVVSRNSIDQILNNPNRGATQQFGTQSLFPSRNRHPTYDVAHYLTQLNSFLKDYPAHPPASDASEKIAQTLGQQGKDAETITAWSDFVEARNFQFDANSDTNRKPDAKSGLTPAEKLARRQQAGAFRIGKIHYSHQRYAEAIEQWRKYITSWPNGGEWQQAQSGIVDAEFQTGLTAVAAGDETKEREVFDAFLARYPLDARARQILFIYGQTRYAAAQQLKEQKAATDLTAIEFQKAISEWARLITKYPGTEESSLALYNTALIISDEFGRLEEGLAAFKRVTWGNWADPAQRRVELMNSKSLAAATEHVFRLTETPTPLADANILVSDGEKIIATGKTGADGIFRAKPEGIEKASSVRILVSTPQGMAGSFLSLGGLGLSTVPEKMSRILFDSPHYRPGDRVGWHAIRRDVKDGSFKVSDAGADWKWRAQLPDGRLLYEGPVTWTPQGLCSGYFILPPSASNGDYRVRVFNSKESLQANFSVYSENAPSRGSITSLNLSGYYFPQGELVKGTFSANYSNGLPVVGGSATLTLPDGTRKEMRTDSAGHVAYEFQTSGLKPGTHSVLLTVPALDIGYTRDFRISENEYSMQFDNLPEVAIAGESFDLKVKATDYQGKKFATAVKLTLVRREPAKAGRVLVGVPWLSGFSSLAKDTPIFEQELNTGAAGEVSQAITLPQSGLYLFKLSGKDKQGHDITAESTLKAGGGENDSKLRLISKATNLVAGQTFKIQVQSGIVHPFALITVHAQEFFSHQLVALKAGLNEFEIPTAAAYTPNFRITVAALDGRQVHLASRPFVLQSGLLVKLSAVGASDYSVKTTDLSGNPVAATVITRTRTLTDGEPFLPEGRVVIPTRSTGLSLESSVSFSHPGTSRKLTNGTFITSDNDQTRLNEVLQLEISNNTGNTFLSGNNTYFSSSNTFLLKNSASKRGVFIINPGLTTAKQDALGVDVRIATKGVSDIRWNDDEVTKPQLPEVSASDRSYVRKIHSSSIQTDASGEKKLGIIGQGGKATAIVAWAVDGTSFIAGDALIIPASEQLDVRASLPESVTIGQTYSIPIFITNRSNETTAALTAEYTVGGITGKLDFAALAPGECGIRMVEGLKPPAQPGSTEVNVVASGVKWRGSLTTRDLKVPSILPTGGLFAQGEHTLTLPKAEGVIGYCLIKAMDVAAFPGASLDAKGETSDASEPQNAASSMLQVLAALTHARDAETKAMLQTRLSTLIAEIAATEREGGGWAWENIDITPGLLTTAFTWRSLIETKAAGGVISDMMLKRTAAFVTGRYGGISATDYERKAVVLQSMAAAGTADFSLLNPLYRVRETLTPIGWLDCALHSFTPDVRKKPGNCSNSYSRPAPLAMVKIANHPDETWQAHGNFLQIEEEIPAGCYFVEDSLSSNAQGVERIGNRLRLRYGPGTMGNVSYEVIALTPGTWTAQGAVLADPYDPARCRRGTANTLTILPPGKPSKDVYVMNRDEHLEAARLLFNRNQGAECLTHLDALVGGKMTQEEERDTAQMRLWILADRDNADAKAMISAFELLTERHPKLVIPFEKLLRVGEAYRRLNEFERAATVFRAALDGAFLEDSGLGVVLEDAGDYMGGVELQEQLWRDYPDSQDVIGSLIGLAQDLSAKAPEAETLPVRRGAKKLEKTSLLNRSRDLLDRFITLYPTDPQADDAAFSRVNVFFSLKDYPGMVRAATDGAERHTASPFTDSFKYMAALGYFWQGEFEKSLTAAAPVANGDSKDRDYARYVTAQGRPKDAITWYEKVKFVDEDAAQAIALFEEKRVSLPEVTIFKPGEEVKLNLDYRNIQEGAVQLYKVDLLKLYLREKSLSNITRVDLAGIAPQAGESFSLGDGKDYVVKSKVLKLPVKDEGAYLAIVRGDNLFTSGLVLISPLKLEVKENPEGRVRATVTDAATGKALADAEVKALDSKNQEVQSGTTDPRGVFAVGDIDGTSTVIVKQGENRYAFHRGTMILQSSRPPELPNSVGNSDPKSSPSNRKVLEKGEYLKNIEESNKAVQKQQIQKWESKRRSKSKGVEASDVMKK